jgi:polyphenol oxidase
MRSEPGAAALPLIRPEWPAPAGVGALMSTREGGVSEAPWASLNLGLSVGDEAAAVHENRRRFFAALRSSASRPAARPMWLHQVHGTQVVELTETTDEATLPRADAAWTRAAGVACIIGAADCLPVLFAARDGRAVAAAHAGWRGLAAGVIEATVQALHHGAGVAAGELLVWLGPCIGPAHFEVGAEVLQAFGVEPRAGPTSPQFRYAPRADGSPRWRADLQGLAGERLLGSGLTAASISADPSCTYADAGRFFSHRRDGHSGGTGRMAAAIWIERDIGR